MLMRKSPQPSATMRRREIFRWESRLARYLCNRYGATCMPALPGRIEIRGLRCRGRQGITPADQQQAHDYLVDVALSVDIAEAVAEDDLAAALDISEVAACVREEIARRPRALVERITADVARALLARFEP